MNILMGPMGKLIKGHVLDVSQSKFDEALQFYDKQLYTTWNPTKLRGHGAWEIRRKPEFNSCLDIAEMGNDVVFKVGPREINLVHHVLDCAFLNYDALRKLKEMDAWQYGDATQYQDEVERRTRDRREREAQATLKERRAMTKYFSKEIKQFKQMVRDGVNPAILAAYWDSVSEAE